LLNLAREKRLAERQRLDERSHLGIGDTLSADER
jgi:hypothetical protein